VTSDNIHTSGNAGFSLLELLVSLALTSTIAVMMATAIAQLRPMQAFEQRLDERIITSTIVDVVARDVQSAVRLPLIEMGGTSSAILKGEPQKIVFTAVVATGYQRSGLSEVTYELIKANGKQQVLRTVRPRRFSQDAEAQLDEVFSGSFDLKLQYLIRNQQGEREWRDEFREINVLPSAVSISVSLLQSPRQEATKIVVPSAN
jgi:prepilin-type N-terminal cleavage/methylation domain-containing protein